VAALEPERIFFDKAFAETKMGNDHNPYQAYTDGSIFSESPLNLVVALYEGAIDATRQAESALCAGDIPGRSRAINKAIAILTELLISLDHERGGEISQNLKRLYSYMQVQLLTAHARQLREPIREVTSLLATLLEGWRGAGQALASMPERVSSAPEESAARRQPASASYASASQYGGYLDDGFGSYSSMAYSL
jgi:flagellar protein FliS